MVLLMGAMRCHCSRVSAGALFGLSGVEPQRFGRWLGVGVGAGLVLAALCGGLASLLESVLKAVGMETAEQSSVQWLLDPATSWAVRVIVAVYAAFVAPVCEEVLYRGMLLTEAMRFRWGVTGAIAAVSVLFALAHGSLVALLPLCLVGVVCALFAVRTGSLLPGIALHATFNLANLALIGVLRE